MSSVNDEITTCYFDDCCVSAGQNEYLAAFRGHQGLPVGTDGNKLGLLRRSLFRLATSELRIRSSLF